jgi:hypothetical protein
VTKKVTKKATKPVPATSADAPSKIAKKKSASSSECSDAQKSESSAPEEEEHQASTSEEMPLKTEEEEETKTDTSVSEEIQSKPESEEGSVVIDEAKEEEEEKEKVTVEESDAEVASITNLEVKDAGKERPRTPEVSSIRSRFESLQSKQLQPTNSKELRSKSPNRIADMISRFQ